MIKILNTRVSGVSYHQDILASLTGNEPCRLVPEPDNQYDPNAIKVMVATDGGPQHVGYVPKGMAGVVSKALDGEACMCRLLEITGDFEGSAALGLRIAIEIQLPDLPTKKPLLIPPFDPLMMADLSDEPMWIYGDWGDQ